MQHQQEKSLLKLSVYAALVFAVGGIVWGWLVSSQMVQFDGYYSLISVGLSMLSLGAAQFIRRHDHKRFPFGKDMLEPIVILFKYSIILLLCIFSIVQAVTGLTTGGRATDIDGALLYSIIGAAGCLAIYLYFKRKSKNAGGFITAESNQWKMDSLLSSAVLIGFMIAAVLSRTDYDFVVPYIDPVMVLIVAGYFIKVPVTEMMKSGREILEMSPDQIIQSQIEAITEDLEKKYDFQESIVRVAKVGGKLFVEIDFVVSPQSSIQTVKMQDQIRSEFSNKIHHMKYTKWLTISFTGDRKWAI
ncbi:hypothetical protein JMA_10200 [Jeotgalibacillus malaysiensis]|uniref:Cation efflux protein transmembrane domain-containing protein n=1 Tax=Jeotgalibacillus malaysiensis TaxID=1508404 RepID=A0A0B5ANW9_9BACL|nr:cation diffusion facilitator family transporter [Jeotgalibacillus malaysiensis]AJD90337.1 hypothetical protein JMA_10200 [Jeotgalibacillus malaysiensis]